MNNIRPFLHKIIYFMAILLENEVVWMDEKDFIMPGMCSIILLMFIIVKIITYGLQH